MTVPSSNLLLLLRLLDNDLPAAIAAQVRARFEKDSVLASQYQRIQIIDAEQYTAEQLLQDVDVIDPDQAAAFVEGALSAEEEISFEEHCWQCDAALRELISLRRGADSISPLTDLGFQVTDAQRQAQQLLAEEATSSNEDSITQLPAFRPPPPVSVHRRTRGDQKFVVVVTLAIVVAAILVVGSSLQDDQETKTVQPAPEVRETQGLPPNDVAPPQDIAHQSEEKYQGPPVKKDDSEPIMVAPVDPDPNKMPDRTPEPPPLNEQKSFWVSWSDISGVSAVRSTSSQRWVGISSPPATKFWMEDQKAQLITLSWSRLFGQLAGGAALIVDAESLLQISSIPESETRTSKGTGIMLDVSRGRVAVSGLHAGQQLLVQVGKEVLQLHADEESTLSMERVQGELILAAHQGRFTSLKGKITPASWGRVDVRGRLSLFSPPARDEWYKSSAAPDTLPDNVCDTLNSAANFLVAAKGFGKSEIEQVQTVSFEAALNCDDQGQARINTTRRLANSRQERERMILIRWLIQQFQQDNKLGEAALRTVCEAQQTPPVLASAMQGWFLSAAYRLRPTQMQLTQLVNGLGGTAPLFSRQCALTFLRQILNDPLQEYDILAPNNRRAMTAVIAKVRRWQNGQ